MENYYIFITDGNIDIDCVNMNGYTREEAFEELNKLWNSYEKAGKYYTYELTDQQGNTIFKNHLD